MQTPKTSQVNGLEITELVQPLIGLTVTRPWKGYGTALFLELGRLRKVSRGPKRQLPSGATVGGGYTLKGRATIMIEWDWRVERQRSIEFGSASSERKIVNGIERMKGLTIENIEVCGRIPELLIQFREKHWLRSSAVIEPQPQWSVFLLDGSWLCVEKGKIWHVPKPGKD